MQNYVPLNDIHIHFLLLLWRPHLLVLIFIKHHSYIKYNSYLCEFRFQVVKVKVKVTVAIYRKALSSF